MKATLCQHTVENAFIAYPEIRGAVLRSDRGTQYTSELYRSTLRKYEITQSMNSACLLYTSHIARTMVF